MDRVEVATPLQGWHELSNGHGKFPCSQAFEPVAARCRPVPDGRLSGHSDLPSLPALGWQLLWDQLGQTGFISGKRTRIDHAS